MTTKIKNWMEVNCEKEIIDDFNYKCKNCSNYNKCMIKYKELFEVD